jgi:hypothetical protein
MQQTLGVPMDLTCYIFKLLYYEKLSINFIEDVRFNQLSNFSYQTDKISQSYFNNIIEDFDESSEEEFISDQHEPTFFKASFENAQNYQKIDFLLNHQKVDSLFSIITKPKSGVIGANCDACKNISGSLYCANHMNCNVVI